MNFLSFSYVLAIRKAGTIRGAAENLYISSQALSEHLNKLEAELGVKLFRRTKPLALTDAGERFVRCAETCLDARRQLETELSEIAARDDRHISLGVPSGMPPPMLLSFLSHFRRVSPELNVTVSELNTQTGAMNDIPDTVDLVFGEFRGDGGRVEYHSVLSSTRFVVALHRELMRSALGDAAAAELEKRVIQGEAAELTAFRGVPFVLKRSGSIIRQNEDRIFRAAGFSPLCAMEAGNMELTLRMVLLGEAAVFLPGPVAKVNFALPTAFHKDDAILLCPAAVSGERWELSIGVSWRRRVTEGMRRFIESAQAFYDQLEL